MTVDRREFLVNLHLLEVLMSANPRKFIFLPDVDSGSMVNPYLDLMIRAWQEAGYERIRFPRGLKEVIRAVKSRGGTTCVANFIDLQLISSDGKMHLSGLISYLKNVLKLRLISKKLVYVRHDIYPHWSRGKSQALAKAVIDLSEVMAFHRVLVHSKHYQGRSRKYVPFPIYEFEEPLPETSPSDALIYLGGFGSYKCLDSLIEAWDRPSRLILAGECQDESYLGTLKALAQGKNVEFVNHRLSDDEAMRLVRSCTAMIVPHALPSYIVSSTLYFGLSCGVPVICIQSSHSRELVSQGFPGIINIESLAELAHLDLEAIKAIDRNEIEAATKALCNLEAVSAMIKRNV
jgi:glycosyltransferase involved in cell wall biosynthesis